MITRASGGQVTGQIVTTEEAELIIADTTRPNVRHVNVPWNDIEQICLRVEP